MVKDHSESGERRSPVELDELARAVARLALEEQLSPQQINERLSKNGLRTRGTRDVQLLIKRARDTHRPLVTVRVEDVGDVPLTNDFLGEELAQIAGIPKVFAVKATLPEGEPSWEPADPNRALTLSHRLHRQIAQPAAAHLWYSLRSHDLIAVGAGRGVRFTVDALRDLVKKRPRRFQDVEVMSITGTGVLRPYPPEPERDSTQTDWPELEADTIARDLGRILRLEPRAMNLVRLPFVLKENGNVIQRVAPHLVGDTWTASRPPDIALFGLGVLNGRHHLMASRGSPEIQPIEHILDELEQTVLSQCSSAIIDVYDTYWVRSGSLPPDLETLAERLVDDLNSNIVAVSRQKLNEAREKMLIAGGPLKYAGILAYLSQRDKVGISPTVFITDETTARHLVRDLSVS